MATGPSVAYAALRRQLLLLLLWSALIHGTAIGIFYLAHMAQRPDSVRQIFMAVWMGVTLLVVLIQLRRIRKLRVEIGRSTRPPSRHP